MIRHIDYISKEKERLITREKAKEERLIAR